MILAVDAGNSRIKWALYNGVTWREHGIAVVDQLGEVWKTLPAPSRIVIANVAGDTVHAALVEAVARWDRKPLWAKAQSSACGVSNRYATGQLGADRWAALLGAWHLRRSPCLVVSAGTALTVDALSADGVFEGGIIVAGYALQHKALSANTAALRAPAGGYAEFPVTTADAIASGALQAMAGAVERMAKLAAQRWAGTPACLLSGGDAERLRPHLNLAVEVMDNLVLEGLIVIARATP